MTVSEIKELFELTTQKIAIIDAETAEIRRESAKIRKETESIRKETEDIRKEAENIRIEARKLAEEDFREMRKILDRTEHILENTTTELGSHTRSIADISEEYFYRGLESSMAIGDMTFKGILKNKVIDKKEYDIILENNEIVMLVSVKTNIKSKHIEKLLEDILVLKSSSRYKSTNRKFYVTIAGLTGGDHIRVLNLAKEKGVLILTLSGEHQPTLVNYEVSPISY